MVSEMEYQPVMPFILINPVYEARNNKNYIACNFCHITKAFDSVSHEILDVFLTVHHELIIY